MNLTKVFIRLFFFIISIIFMIAFSVGIEEQADVSSYLLGAVLGIVIGLLLIGFDLLFKRFSLRSFNIVVVGLFIGYLMSLALLLIFEAVLNIGAIHPHHFEVEAIKIFIFLFGTYLGVMMTLRASDEIYISIPFIKFAPSQQAIKDVLADLSAINDPRMIDLAATGLLDKRLVLPRFLLMELSQLEDSEEEPTRSRAKRALEVIKKLEAMPTLQLRYHDTDFPEIKDFTSKILRLARLLDAEILSADLNRVQIEQTENIHVINMHALSNALKPLMQRGEVLKIKIQRHGKEENQGVGYLDDGTMVVVNGGGNYIGETIEASVLSVKHTTTGRLIFCNVFEESGQSHVDESY